MALDLLLALQPRTGGTFADAAAEARILCRRVTTAAKDMEEVMAGVA